MREAIKTLDFGIKSDQFLKLFEVNRWSRVSLVVIERSGWLQRGEWIGFGSSSAASFLKQ